MAVRRAQEFRSMGVADLEEELEQQKSALYQLRYRLATHQLADVSEIRKTRKEIARINTLLTEKVRGICPINPGAAVAPMKSSKGGEQK
jgi:large subunit ribosomal protein L29